MGALAVNYVNFDCEVLKSTKPVVVDFWARWCNPCMSLAPIIDELADELADKVKITKLDIEIKENATIKEKYKIASIPTIILFKDGKIVNTMVGGSSKSNISSWILSMI
ncbi:MAG: thioredoxin [Candidatus Liberibacter europaeus]|uniref:Thioredoxin n=1 Tax=Candidatus Liberibacter europaeus TaxID=744859 RepID=A0A2T4VZ89_9HYPH|nr:thioredoxin [Candidatus Liberibacter europaeus]PTL87091.1 MAG: thioredoxin [Candidatus Liberibacter europaeus]